MLWLIEDFENWDRNTEGSAHLNPSCAVLSYGTRAEKKPRGNSPRGYISLPDKQALSDFHGENNTPLPLSQYQNEKNDKLLSICQIIGWWIRCAEEKRRGEKNAWKKWLESHGKLENWRSNALSREESASWLTDGGREVNNDKKTRICYWLT